MEIKEMNMDQINERLSAIKAELETAENIEELTNEVNALNERKSELVNQAEERAAAIKKVVEAEGTPAIKPIEEKEKMERNFAIDSAEYRNAWLKNLMGKELDAEERAAITATAAIPTETLNEVTAVLKKNALLSKIDMFNIPGYVRIPVESAAAAASWTSTSTDSEDALTYIDLTPYQLIKTVLVPADVNAMSIPAFESYLVAQLANKIETALQVAVIAGDGSSKATGIATTISTATGTFTKASVTKKDLLHIMGSLDDEFQKRAIWIMPAAVFYDEVMNLSDHNAFANINNGFEIKLFGHDVVLDGACTISSADNIFYGDPKHYRMNLGENIKVDKDASVEFRSNAVCYRAVCQADGKLDMAKAFVRFTRAN